MRSAVDFPQPEGPTSTSNSPSSMARLRSETASMPPSNVFVIDSKATEAICVAPLRCRLGTTTARSGHAPGGVGVEALGYAAPQARELGDDQPGDRGGMPGGGPGVSIVQRGSGPTVAT